MAVEKVIHGAGEQPLQTYLDRRQEKVVECVALWYIFEVHARDTGNKGGGELRDPWQRQVAVEKQLRVTLEDILAATKEQNQRESGRCGEGQGGEEGEANYSMGEGEAR